MDNLIVPLYILLIILSFVILYKILLEQIRDNIKKEHKKESKYNMSDYYKITRGDLYKLLLLQLLPFIICELYKDRTFFDTNNPLQSKVGEILLILFTYILYTELLFNYL